MKPLLRAWIPLLVGLALLGWGTRVAVRLVTHAWLLREVALRSQAAAAGGRDAIVERLEKGELPRAAALLEKLTGAERATAAALCTPSLRTLSSTRGFPGAFACDALRARLPAGAPLRELEFSDEAADSPVHVSVFPLVDEGEALGALVLVHDLGFVARREATAAHLALAVFAPPTVFRYLRAADVCYVSSLHDGMNLVAKEFVAARDDEGGVLVLSRFTGAAQELAGALLVNPYDLEEASAALAAALAMPAAEQRERMRAMRQLVAEFSVFRWAGRMLVDAARIRGNGRLTDRLATGALRVVRA